MAIFEPYRCHKCFEEITLVQPQAKDGEPKGKAKVECVFCGWHQEFQLYNAQPNEERTNGEEK